MHKETNFIEERTGLHEREFIETRRYTLKEKTGIGYRGIIYGKRTLESVF